MRFAGPGRATQTVSAIAMSALLMASAMQHFRKPRFFHQVVPDVLCRDDSAREAKGGPGRPMAVMSRDEWVALSGLIEAGAAVGLLIPATRRATATGVTVMFTAFIAGHVDALRRAYGPTGTAKQRSSHTVRLPLQLPLILWAWSLRNVGTGPRH